MREWINLFEALEVEFRDECHGAAHGQTDCSIAAYVDGNKVGFLDYAVYRGIPHIQMVKVAPEFRRNGIGVAMARRLQKMFPDQEIGWGSMTPDGVALKRGIPHTTVRDEELDAKIATLNALRAKEAEYQKLVDAFEKIDSPTEEQRQNLLDKLRDWNDIHDAIWQLEREIGDKSPEKNLIA